MMIRIIAYDCHVGHWWFRFRASTSIFIERSLIVLPLAYWLAGVIVPETGKCAVYISFWSAFLLWCSMIWRFFDHGNAWQQFVPDIFNGICKLNWFLSPSFLFACSFFFYSWSNVNPKSREHDWHITVLCVCVFDVASSILCNIHVHFHFMSPTNVNQVYVVVKFDETEMSFPLLISNYLCVCVCWPHIHIKYLYVYVSFFSVKAKVKDVGNVDSILSDSIMMATVWLY